MPVAASVLGCQALNWPQILVAVPQRCLSNQDLPQANRGYSSPLLISSPSRRGRARGRRRRRREHPANKKIGAGNFWVQSPPFSSLTGSIQWRPQPSPLTQLMFRSRRANLVQRLWRLRGVTPGLDDNHGALKPVAHALFKKLKDKELELLLQAVENQGAGESGCVWLEPRGIKLGPSASLLLCRLYRWPDLRQPQELKRLCFCKTTGGEGGAHCCNPHHLSRLAAPDSPPPPYCKISPFPAPLNGTSILENNCRGWQDTTLSRCSLKDGYWCKLAYWEYRLRVGRLYPVHEDHVCVFSSLLQGNGLCLGQLASRSHSQAVRRTQAKIGRGLLLSQEASGVWAYNRSEHPLFVSSPTLGPVGGSAPPVHKILPGYSVKVFDYERAAHLAARRPAAGEGPHDEHTVRISFAKGWGPTYTRRFITSCPCWLEVLLNAPS